MRRLAVVAGVSLLLAGCGAPGARPMQAGAAGSQLSWAPTTAAQRTCTTSSAGTCTLPHDMGVIPDGVTVVLADRAGFAQVTGKTATGITVKAIKSVSTSGTATVWASTAVTFEVTAVYTPATTPPTTTPTTAPPGAWPNPGNTGTPPGWTPTTTQATDLVVSTAGAVVTDVRLTGGASVYVRAANVTLRRLEINGGVISNENGSTCYNGLTVEDTSILKGSTATIDGTLPAISPGGYTATRVKIQGWPEGFRVGGKSDSPACGPVTVNDSWAQVRYPDTCVDWHGDGLQGYDGAAVTVNHTYLELVESASCSGTAPFFYPAGQGNTSATVNGLIVKGGGYPFRLGMPGSVQGLRVVDGSWAFGPTDVSTCAQLTAWQAVKVTVDANYQPTDGAAIPCG